MKRKSITAAAFSAGLLLAATAADAGGLAQALGNMGAIANGYANPGQLQQLLELQRLQQLQQFQQYQPQLNYQTYTFPNGQTLHCYGALSTTTCR